MASTATIRYIWPEGTSLICQIQADTSYPDAMDEARTQCEAMFRQAWADLEDDVTVDAEDD